MAAKLSEGDTIAMPFETTAASPRLHGFGTPITTTGEHLSLMAKKKAERRKPLCGQAGPGAARKKFDPRLPRRRWINLPQPAVQKCSRPSYPKKVPARGLKLR